MYLEEKAIAYMRASIPEEVSAKLDDDEFINIIDMIFDFYDENDLLDVDAESEEDDDSEVFESLVKYVKKMLSKDPYSLIPIEYIENIVKAELEYEGSTLDELFQ